MDIYLVVFQVSPTEAPGAERQVSVWLQAGSGEAARAAAEQALREAGWQPDVLLDVTATDEDDYFRECPSQQAFERAKREGLAWRFHDEE